MALWTWAATACLAAPVSGGAARDHGARTGGKAEIDAGWKLIVAGLDAEETDTFVCAEEIGYARPERRVPILGESGIRNPVNELRRCLDDPGCWLEVDASLLRNVPARLLVNVEGEPDRTHLDWLMENLFAGETMVHRPEAWHEEFSQRGGELIVQGRSFVSAVITGWTIGALVGDVVGALATATELTPQARALRLVGSLGTLAALAQKADAPNDWMAKLLPIEQVAARLSGMLNRAPGGPAFDLAGAMASLDRRSQAGRALEHLLRTGIPAFEPRPDGPRHLSVVPIGLAEAEDGGLQVHVGGNAALRNMTADAHGVVVARNHLPAPQDPAGDDGHVVFRTHLDRLDPPRVEARTLLGALGPEGLNTHVVAPGEVAVLWSDANKRASHDDLGPRVSLTRGTTAEEPHAFLDFGRGTASDRAVASGSVCTPGPGLPVEGWPSVASLDRRRDRGHHSPPGDQKRRDHRRSVARSARGGIWQTWRKKTPPRNGAPDLR